MMGLESERFLDAVQLPQSSEEKLDQLLVSARKCIADSVHGEPEARTRMYRSADGILASRHAAAERVYNGYAKCECGALPNNPCRDRSMSGYRVTLPKPHHNRPRTET